jgi:glycosyltransferase involved in cell wall biosynthesis
MRIVFIEQESQLGGVEYTTLRIAGELSKMRLEPIIICPQEGDLPRLARQAGVKVQIVPRPKFPSVSSIYGRCYIFNLFGFIVTAVNVIRATRIMERQLPVCKADIVITKGLLAHFYGGIAALRLNIPCIWYIQEEVNKKRGWGLFRYILAKGAINIPTKILVDAEALREQFDGLSTLRATVDVVYNGIDVEEFSPFSPREQQEAKERLGIPADAVVIGQAGRIIPLKGQAILLDAFVRLLQEFPDLHLLFVGAPLFGSQDYEKKMRIRVTHLGLADRVHFPGFLPDVRQGLAAINIFVHSSIETDSPISVMEAMACALPVVVSGVHGTVEMVTPQVDALVFEPGDSNALALMLRKLLKSRQLQRKMGNLARATVVGKFSLKASAKRLQKFIEKVYES